MPSNDPCNKSSEQCRQTKMPNTLFLNLGASDDHSNSDLSGKIYVLHVLLNIFGLHLLCSLWWGRKN